MSDSWVNWGDFTAANKQENERKASEYEQMSREQQAVMDKALASLNAGALDVARSGKFTNLSQMNGYSDLMKQRDAALQAAPLHQQAAPWESDMQTPEFHSPWADLQKRLGSMNNKLAQRNTTALNQQAWEKQQADIRAFNKAQAEKLKASQQNPDTAQYIKWSNAVQKQGTNSMGAGAGAYYDAQQGTGPQPVSAGYGPKVQGQQSWLRKNNQNQIMPETTSSSFGQNPNGF